MMVDHDYTCSICGVPHSAEHICSARKMTREERINSIKARLGSISKKDLAKIYGIRMAAYQLLTDDLKFLLENLK